MKFKFCVELTFTKFITYELTKNIKTKMMLQTFYTNHCIFI